MKVSADDLEEDLVYDIEDREPALSARTVLPTLPPLQVRTLKLALNLSSSIITASTMSTLSVSNLPYPR
jgi:hypothetical protein